MEKLYSLFQSCSGICTDTRKIEKDCFFICLKGENFDGNKFTKKALELGAKYVVIDDANVQTDESMLLVENGLQFLQELANYHRKQFDIPVIGITGSNGKTTTKELIHAVLSKSYNVLATKGNLNNHIGVPLTLLQLTDKHEIGIIEMGASKSKDIEELCAIAEPNYGIITNVGKAHLEGFTDFKGVLSTKKELYKAIEKNKGRIIYNADDTILSENIPIGVRTTTYSATDDSANIQGTLIKLSPFIHMQWKTPGYKSEKLSTTMIGKYNFYNFLAAICFGKTFDVPNQEIDKAVVEYTPTNNRSQVEKTTTNTVIMDCYNANPTSMKSAIESFAMMEHPNKFFILGDMKELGTESEKEHQFIGELLEQHQLKGISVGEEFLKVPSSAFVQQFDTTATCKNYLAEHQIEEKLILLKGSRSIGLEILMGNL